MRGAASWIGPAIVAAFISALVTGLGWLVSERQARRRDTLRRGERVVDMQTALLAEIRASRHRIEGVARNGILLDRIMDERDGYTPFVPKQVSPVLFDALVGEIHILPTDVIDPIVVYYRQRTVVANLVDDIRSERYDKLDQLRKRSIYGDFLQLMEEADRLALDAERALRRSLNIQAADSSDPRSGAGPDEVSAAVAATRSDP